MVAVKLFYCFDFKLNFFFQILCRMANISNDERNMVGLPIEGEEEEKEEEEEQEHTYNEANIPAETDPEAVEIIEQEQTSE